MQDYYTVQQVAEKLQLKSITIQRMLRTGQLKGIKINKRIWRIPHSSLDEYVRGGSDAS